jgi:hypothetical protein
MTDLKNMYDTWGLMCRANTSEKAKGAKTKKPKKHMGGKTVHT